MSRAADTPFLPFSLPEVGSEEAQAVAETLASGWLTTGPRARELEERLAQRLGARHALALASCTAALQLALHALRAKPGDVVITSPYSFTSGAEAALHAGLVPRFSDIDPRTLNLAPRALRQTLLRLRDEGKTVAAIMPVHIAGLPCDLEAIDALATEFSCPLIEDAAHALPSRYRGSFIGARRPSGHPLATCFSFYANKTLTTGEGGMLMTDDKPLDERCRRLALHGIDRDGWTRQGSVVETGKSRSRPHWDYDVTEAGFKANMSDLAAAVGLAQLAKMDAMHERRRCIAESYNRAFGKHPALEIPASQPDCETSWHLYILRLQLRPEENTQALRDRWAEELRARGIGTSLHYRPLHLHSLYRRALSLRPKDFPVSLAQSQRALSLPIYSRMREADTQRVIREILASLETLLGA